MQHWGFERGHGPVDPKRFFGRRRQLWCVVVAAMRVEWALVKVFGFPILFVLMCFMVLNTFLGVNRKQVVQLHSGLLYLFVGFEVGAGVGAEQKKKNSESNRKITRNPASLHAPKTLLCFLGSFLHTQQLLLTGLSHSLFWGQPVCSQASSGVCTLDPLGWTVKVVAASWEGAGAKRWLLRGGVWKGWYFDKGLVCLWFSYSFGRLHTTAVHS